MTAGTDKGEEICAGYIIDQRRFRNASRLNAVGFEADIAAHPTYPVPRFHRCERKDRNMTRIGRGYFPISEHYSNSARNCALKLSKLFKVRIAP